MPANPNKLTGGFFHFFRSYRSAGTLLMLASAFLFSVLDGLIKLMGPGFRIWDIAFYRFGYGSMLIVGSAVFANFTGTGRHSDNMEKKSLPSS